MNPLKSFVLGLVGITAGLVCAPKTAAQELFPEASQAVILWSARSCYAEATWAEADCSALLHVIRKRATKTGWSFLRMLRAYSVKNWIQSGHGVRANQLKLGFNKGLDKDWNYRWQQLVTHVVDVLNGRVADPCPIADHWAAIYYAPKSPMRRVACAQPMANQFWVSLNR